MSKWKLTKANYYQDRYYWTASLAKTFFDCPDRAVADWHNKHSQKMTPALMIGSYVDAYLDGKRALNAFCKDHPEIFNSRTGELKADYLQANEMVARAKQSRTFMSYLTGYRQKIFTGTIAGVPFKCKCDFWHKDKFICDLKTAKDFEPLYREGEGRLSFIEYWRWPLQGAIYQELCYQATGHRLPFYLAIISKQDPPALKLVQVSQHMLDTELRILAEKLPLWDAMMKGVVEPDRCELCDWCRQTKVIDEPEVMDYDGAE